MNKFNIAKQKAAFVYTERFKSLSPRHKTLRDKLIWILLKLNKKLYAKYYIHNSMILNIWYVNYQDARFDDYMPGHVGYMLKYNKQIEEIELIAKTFDYSCV